MPNHGDLGKRARALLAWRASYAPIVSFVQLLNAAEPSRHDVFLMWAGTITAILGGMPFPILGLLYGKVVDELADCSAEAGTDSNSSEQWLSVQNKVLGMFAVALCNFTMIYAYNGCWGLFGERLTYRIRFAYMRALLRQEPAFFHSLPSGEMATRLDTDIQNIQTGTGEKVAHYISTISYFITAYAVAFSQDAALTWKLATLVPVYVLYAQYTGKLLERFSTQVANGVSSATNLASESLQNIPLVHAFSAGKKLEDLFSQRLQAVASAVTKKTVTAAGQMAFLYTATYISNALAFWQGSVHMAAARNGENGSSVGRIYTVLACVLDASLMFASLSHYLTYFIGARTSFDNLVPVMQRDTAIDGMAETTGLPLTSSKGCFELKGVSFAYPSRPDTQVLNHVSLELLAGKVTALVGLSGSGKSTIATLLNRIYDPAAGHLELDGVDLRQWNVKDLRHHISVVEQEPTLMNRSILENVAYGLAGSLKWPPGAVERLAAHMRNTGQNAEEAAGDSQILIEVVRRVRKALKQAQAYYFVERLEHGIATKVGTRGLHLSGGQRQRIAIARALARNAPVLVLDEATSALDTATEVAILQSLSQSMPGRTIILIAHRLSSIKHVDKVIVMRNGDVIEEGGYKELLDSNGHFTRMVEMQALQNHVEQKSGKDFSTIGASTAGASTTEHEAKEISEFRESSKSADLQNTPADFTGEDEGNDDLEDLPLLDSELKDSKEDADDTMQKVDAGKAPYRKVFGRIYEYTRVQRSLIYTGIATATFVGLTWSIEAVMFGQAIGALTVCGLSAERIIASGQNVGIAFLILAVLSFGTTVVSSYCFGNVSEYLLNRVRILSLRSLLQQDVEWHEDKGRTPSSLLSYISADASSLGNITGNLLGVSIGVIVSLIVGPVLAHIIAWKIAIVILAIIPILVGAGIARVSVLTKFQDKHREAFDASVGIATEAVGAINTVAAFGLEEEMLASYQRALNEPYAATVRLVIIGNCFLALGYSIPNALNGIAYWWGSKLIIAGEYDQAQFQTVLPAMLVGAVGCGQLFNLLSDVARATSSGARVFSLIDLLPKSHQRVQLDIQSHESGNSGRLRERDEDATGDLPEKSDLDVEAIPLMLINEKEVEDADKPRPIGGARVSMTDVSFAYPSRPSTVVLQDININIQPGQLAAFVGPSGSGKSTIFGLLERFYRPTTGSVVIGHEDISKSDDTTFRRNISLVPQTNMLFDANVTFNLDLGSSSESSVSQARLEEAARRANIHDTIMGLPQQYETPCGTNGKDFSGGQRQRLSLARALVRDPSLLLLDEPTSALDSESEARWQETLQELRGEATILIIAHRLHTIQMADVIFLIHDGRCEDRGTHQELMQRNERYRTNVMQQVLD
ncbi:Leptomycin B resistance protein pmd1 [Cercospora beticola]|uniref:Leptomycin B resistance protein pmd1 n=1 Tax=Cercospora beticola TaxID=122368 RepID=A0A2G5HBC1_CERBT|nr:Leptomycin B resistance protein pmd1 [Cercospora beticola]PIA89542.1 Leptomycin B resistance protein pmd1 [Cercospora beticola]WPB03351.1 hypothetical protein RHO25_007988 [Cercospora beticola]